MFIELTIDYFCAIDCFPKLSLFINYNGKKNYDYKYAKVAVVWFKRDLECRIIWKSKTKQAIAFYLFMLLRMTIGHNHLRLNVIGFSEECLKELRINCAALGMPLVVRKGDVCSVLADLQKQFDLQSIYAHEETGNCWTYER